VSLEIIIRPFCVNLGRDEEEFKVNLSWDLANHAEKCHFLDPLSWVRGLQIVPFESTRQLTQKQTNSTKGDRPELRDFLCFCLFKNILCRAFLGE
jgi:hypothetical protein